MEKKMETTTGLRAKVLGGMEKKMETTLGFRVEEEWQRTWKLL